MVLDVGVSRAKAEVLRRLYQGDRVLVLPNAWDCASARVFEDCRFPAIATTSAGVAWALGYADGERLGVAEMAGAVARIARSVSVPVTADVEAGYGDSPEAVLETARAVIRAGAVGLNLEDAAFGGEAGLLDPGVQSEKIRAAVQAGRELGVPLVINARTDVYWGEIGAEEERFGETVSRASAYLEAGADCAFVPGVKDPETIAALVQEIPGPLNVLGGPGAPIVPELGTLGVRRVSLGSGPARAAMGLTRTIGRELLRSGAYSEIERTALPYAEANAFFGD